MRILAVGLCVLLLLSSLPIPAAATETDTTRPPAGYRPGRAADLRPKAAGGLVQDACGAPASALLVQDTQPWATTSLQSALDDLGIPFDQIRSDQLAGHDLSAYNMLVYSSDQSRAYYQRLADEIDRITAFVAAGGVLVGHVADRGWQGADWDGLQILPLGITHSQSVSETIAINAPAHAIAGGEPEYHPLTPAYLSGWNYSTHGILTNLPAGAVTIFSAPAGPVMVEYPVGQGLVIATMQTLEWGYGVRGRPEVLRNELRYARSRAAAPAIPVFAEADLDQSFAPAQGEELTWTFTIPAACLGGELEARIEGPFPVYGPAAVTAPVELMSEAEGVAAYQVQWNGQITATDDGGVYPTWPGAYTLTVTLLTGGQTAAATATFTVANRPGVLYLPGLLGAELLHNGATRWPAAASADLSDLGLIEAGPDPDARPADAFPVVSVGDPLPSLGAVSRGQDLLQRLQADPLSYHVTAIAYDWRHDVRTAAADLATAVDALRRQAGHPEPALICHGLGCLAAAHYVQQHQPHHLGLLVSLGAPWLGTPGAYAALRFGPSVLGAELAADAMASLLRTLPAAWQWLPAAAYQQQAGPFIHDYAPDLPAPAPLDYAAAAAFMEELMGWGYLGRYNAGLHTGLDPGDLPVPLHVDIIGAGRDTITGLVHDRVPFWKNVAGVDATGIALLLGDGDGVTAAAAADLSAGAPATRITRFVAGDHDLLPDLAAVQDYIVAILDGQAADPAPGILPDLPGRQTRQVEVRFPAAVRVYADGGGHTGPGADGVAHHLAGVGYWTQPDGTVVSLPPGGYTIVAEAEGAGLLDVRITYLNDGQIARRVWLNKLPVSPGSRVLFAPGDLGDAVVFAVDADGNGETDALWAPDADLTPPDALDSGRPVTQIAPAGPMGDNGWFIGPVTVSLTAADAETGVAGTYYSLDAGATTQFYTGPFALTAEGVFAVWAGSTDLAGNEETNHPQMPVGIDMTPPRIAWGGLEDVYIYNDPILLDFTAVDDISGVAALHGSLSGRPVTAGEIVTPPVGRHVLRVEARDHAGHPATGMHRFQVRYHIVWHSPLSADGSAPISDGKLTARWESHDIHSVSIVDTSVAAVLYRDGRWLPVASFVWGHNISHDGAAYVLDIDLASYGFVSGDSGRLELWFGNLAHGGARFHME